MEAIGEFDVDREDGGLPTTLAVGRAPGESGVPVLSQRFCGGVHLKDTPRQHHVCFQMSSLRINAAWLGARFGTRPRREAWPSAQPVSIALSADQSVAMIRVAIDPGQLALAAAEDSALEARLIGRLSGYDRALFESARTLALESADNYPNGPLYWSEVAGAFVDGLIARHTAGPEIRIRGTLGKDILERLKDYIVAHLDVPIDVAALAAVAGRSPFHFSRVFARSVGMTPHRYVVRLRLQRAMELVRDERSSLAEIAARTGFADQSHLSRWIRRVHGVTITQLRSADRQQQR